MKNKNTNNLAAKGRTGQYQDHICRATETVTATNIALRFRSSRPRDRYHADTQTLNSRDQQEEKLLVSFVNQVIESLGKQADIASSQRETANHPEA